MESKAFEFHGTAGGYVKVFFVTLITSYIPIFGWPIAFNYGTKWIADNSLIKGRKVAYTAKYGETLTFLFINTLLLIITLGIYVFWFVPKQYRFIADRCSFVDEPMVTPLPNAAASPIS